MILYFANRNIDVIGLASTRLTKGLKITSDTKITSLETGTKTLECDVIFDNDTRLLCEQCVKSGNYIFASTRNGAELYSIVTTEENVADSKISFYAEDAGIELINSIALKNPDGSFELGSMTCTELIDLYLTNTGFEIGINQSANDETTITPAFDSESTISERLMSIASSFGYKINFRYELSSTSFNIEKKYVDIYASRGADYDVRLMVGHEVKNITTKTSIQDLATTLLAYGGTPDGGSVPITLEGYTYSSDNNDFQVVTRTFYERDGLTHACLESPSALGSYGAIVDNTVQPIIKVFESPTSTLDQDKLAEEAAAELESISKPTVTYEIELYESISNVNIGDTVHVIDEKSKTYISSIVQQIEESECDSKVSYTLSDVYTNENGSSSWSSSGSTSSSKETIVIDDSLSSSSINPVQNKAVTQALNNLTATVSTKLTTTDAYGWIDLTNSCDYAVDVTKTGTYRSYLKYNPYTHEVKGCINTSSSVANQGRLLTMPSLDGIGTNSYTGLCGAAVMPSTTMLVNARVSGNVIYSSHTVNSAIAVSRAYLIDFVAE